MKLKILFILLILSFTKIISVSANPKSSQSNQTSSESSGSFMDIYNIAGGGCSEAYDPYEKFNRVIFSFNDKVDKWLLRPIAVGYDKVTNDYFKSRVGSFIDNIGTPLSTVNHALQLNYDNTMKSFWRFMINTTLGIGGLFDVASKVGLTNEPQGFGDTLAAYGVGPGPYIVLPLLGGTTARGMFDNIFTTETLIPHSVLHNTVKLCYSGGRVIHSRARLLPLTDNITENSLDPYANIRSSIFQNRESNVKYPKNFICPTKK